MPKASSKDQNSKLPTEKSHPLAALENAPDNALAITAAAYMDQALELLLRSRFRDLSTEEYEWLFGKGGKGVLATTAAKIRIGYAAGFYEKESYFDMLIVDVIRNTFARSLDTMTFNSDLVYRECRQLGMRKQRKHLNDDNQPFDPRRAYYNAVVDLCVGVQVDIRGDMAWAI